MIAVHRARSRGRPTAPLNTQAGKSPTNRDVNSGDFCGLFLKSAGSPFLFPVRSEISAVDFFLGIPDMHFADKPMRQTFRSDLCVKTPSPLRAAVFSALRFPHCTRSSPSARLRAASAVYAPEGYCERVSGMTRSSLRTFWGSETHPPSLFGYKQEKKKERTESSCVIKELLSASCDGVLAFFVVVVEILLLLLLLCSYENINLRSPIVAFLKKNHPDSYLLWETASAPFRDLRLSRRRLGGKKNNVLGFIFFSSKDCRLFISGKQRSLLLCGAVKYPVTFQRGRKE